MAAGGRGCLILTCAERKPLRELKPRRGRLRGVSASRGMNGTAASRSTIRPMISREEVEHVAALARLGLTAEEIDRMQTQLSRILEAIEQLRDVDTSQVGPTAQVIALENVMRDDLARPGLSREAALANAPEREGPFLRVPTILAEGR
jgi:aspartyl-tRNA(Asn)/glutamyl-tRNA(Gln) amidotransferase subunit C